MRKKYIDLDAIIDKLENEWGYQGMREELYLLPAADVEEVKHAKWEICCDGYYPYCSNCKREPQGREMTDYCPNCGAKMDEVIQNDRA